MHEGSCAALYIQHYGVCTGGQLFAHYAGGDQRYALHRSGNVPEGVHELVSRHEVTALSYDAEADPAHYILEFIYVLLYTYPRHRLKLVEGPAGMAQSAAAHLGYRTAAGSHKRRYHKGCGIAHAAGGVLIHLYAGKVRKVNNVA